MSYIASRRHLLLTSAVLTVSPGLVLAGTGSYADREAVRAWAKETAKAYGMPYDWVIGALRQAKHNKTAARIMSKPKLTATAKPQNWYAHKSSILTFERTFKGERFLKTHADAFKRAHATWGVPPSVVAAIIGIESAYGRKMGQHRVIDVLATLSFDYTRRETFFKKELASFLQWCHRSHLDPTKQLGSFAGAVGMTQFMPSNILSLGVDFDKDGAIDLRNSPVDAIGSVARYLNNAGWQEGLPVAWPCRADKAIAKRLKSGGIRTHTTVQEALKAGVRLDVKPRPKGDTPVLLVSLPVVQEDGTNTTLWRLGSKNFAAILNYNRSYFYAESVRELARSLESTEREILGKK